ncbi:FadR family transcriptional regulator [Mesorhizobium sp. CA13]|uniref:FadR/GntR family transcriptional regulator n=1 Tax=unclassified Mesorhizobium TaxID=325217 RepID=UPI00112CC310|nr:MULTISPECIES: FadR/GntR family transcriptional regulator [unclassified Mesorhizobium]MBZ9857447.1 FadR family transcriptional regulator [Mesorhizobium sp. CA13]MBZ9921398.1 FadR family transcriptional regulator [Mesorhizobium sp. BR1-1-7]MBZ9966654.1 FadR family transcriptional regulator [Mesorhizobium sp. BR1-1-2]MCA0014815.1 FadR family transcriptional regulator [Mesorhizobium sp. B294B1A1]MCA0041064.1 FadR family transcriptional regulator [Mesorhizobium sp. B292B1B]
MAVKPLPKTEDVPDATTIGPASLKDRIARDIGQRILSGRYPPLSILPSEAELCAAYDASRTALRDALLTLAAKGLIEARKRAGTHVRLPSDWNRLDAQVLDWMSGIEPDLGFVRGLIEARLVIEPAAAQLAAKMASSGDLAIIEAAYEAMCDAPEDDLSACLDADVRFHTGILRASRNPVFANLGNMLAAALNFSFRLTTSATANFQATLSAHGDVLEAIRMRRADDAYRQMKALIGIASIDLLTIADGAHRDRPVRQNLPVSAGDLH